MTVQERGWYTHIARVEDMKITKEEHEDFKEYLWSRQVTTDCKGRSHMLRVAMLTRSLGSGGSGLLQRSYGQRRRALGFY